MTSRSGSMDNEGEASSQSGGASPSDPAAAKLTVAGPISIVSGDVPEERRAWAKAMLATTLASYQPQDNGVEPDALAGEDTKKVDGKRRSITAELDASLTPALADLGYSRIAKFNFRATWGSRDIEHFLNVQTQYVPPSHLDVSAGLLNSGADQFSDYAKKYTTPGLRALTRRPGLGEYKLGFSLSFIDAWRGDRLVKLFGVDADDVAATVKDAVASKLMPRFARIKTCADLFDLLSKDEEPLRWFRCNALQRIAQLAYLGKKLGYSDPDIETVVTPHFHRLKYVLDPSIAPQAYLASVIADAAAAVRKGQE